MLLRFFGVVFTLAAEQMIHSVLRFLYINFALLVLWTVKYHHVQCCATEPGYAGDIGAIEMPLIDWLINDVGDLCYSSSQRLQVTSVVCEFIIRYWAQRPSSLPRSWRLVPLNPDLCFHKTRLTSFSWVTPKQSYTFITRRLGRDTFNFKGKNYSSLFPFCRKQ